MSELITAGLRAVQIRDKGLAAPHFQKLAADFRQLSQQMPVRIFVNSRIDAAKEFGWNLHLPEGSDIAAARRELGDAAVISASCHSLDSALAAHDAGANCIVFGPIFSTLSKTLERPPLGLKALTEVCAACATPVVAIGGITPQNARSCLDAGAQAVASIGALLGADAPDRALLDFMRSLGRL